MTPAAEPDVAPTEGAAPRRRSPWFWLVAGTLAVVLAFSAVTLWYFYRPPRPEHAHIDAYRASADGNIFEVQYTSLRDCDETLWAKARETTTEVVVDVAYPGFANGEAHDAMLRLCQETIPLEAPLGSRVVTDVEGAPVSDVWMTVSP